MLIKGKIGGMILQLSAHLKGPGYETPIYVSSVLTQIFQPGMSVSMEVWFMSLLINLTGGKWESSIKEESFSRDIDWTLPDILRFPIFSKV